MMVISKEIFFNSFVIVLDPNYLQPISFALDIGIKAMLLDCKDIG